MLLFSPHSSIPFHLKSSFPHFSSCLYSSFLLVYSLVFLFFLNFSFSLLISPLTFTFLMLFSPYHSYSLLFSLLISLLFLSPYFSFFLLISQLHFTSLILFSPYFYYSLIFPLLCSFLLNSPHLFFCIFSHFSTPFYLLIPFCPYFSCSFLLFSAHFSFLLVFPNLSHSLLISPDALFSCSHPAPNFSSCLSSSFFLISALFICAQRLCFESCQLSAHVTRSTDGRLHSGSEEHASTQTLDVILHF